MKKATIVCMSILLTVLLAFAGCADGNKENTNQETANQETTNKEDETMSEEVTKNPTATTAPADDKAALFKEIEKAKNAKGMLDNNPLMTQRFGADPYALVYDDTLYIYMTGDTPEYDENGNLGTNTYQIINKINVISTKDMVNWTDHGSIYAAGKNGAAKTANNSWAPAAAWKMIDGKPKFFLYFANNGSGIFVLTADSPTGPFTDPLGTELISRRTPNCDWNAVPWLFDPAVFVDDDGSAYLYFGGGVGPGKEAHPYSARVVKLGDDMISLDGEPVAIDPPFLFEDSGIHKMGNTYYYTYSSNFSVTPEGTKEYGLENGEICYMTSENPMGPFTYQGVILPNPGKFFGVGGNNHHCVFNFRGDWYITYHAESIEDRLGMEVKGYRSTHIDKLAINEDGTLGSTKGTRAGVEQNCKLNPYEVVEAETIWNSAGVSTTQYGESETCGSGNMVVCGVETGSWIGLKGVDFGEKGASEIVASVCGGAEEGVVQIRIDRLMGDIVGYLTIPAGDGATYTEQVGKLLETVTGVHDLYFTFYGSGYTWDTWQFR